MDGQPPVVLSCSFSQCQSRWYEKKGHNGATGASVTALERDQIGKAASYGNAGSIAPGHPPINKPGRVRQALKSPPSSAPPCVRRPPIRPSAREAALVFSPYLHGKAHGIFHANPWTPSATSAASAAKLPLHC